MAHAVAQRDALAAVFGAVQAGLPAGPAWLATARAAAFERFQAAGFPTSRDEEWRFTPVAPIAATPFERPGDRVPARADIDPFGFEGMAAEIVLVNGRVAPALSRLDRLPSGLTVRSLRDAWQNGHAAGGGPDLEALADPTPRPTPFVDLNTALAEDGVVIDVAPKAVIPDPVHVLHVTMAGGVPVVASPRLIVRVGEQAQVSLVETYAGLGSGTTFTNAVTQVEVGAAARVEHVKLHREPAQAFHLASTIVRTGRAGVFASRAITVGGRIVRNDIASVLDGEGAECTLDGLYVADGETLVDTHTTIDHAQPHCPSHEVYKGILSGRARAVFNGKIIVRPQAQKTDAKQTNKALLLSDEARINTKPQLEIFADDVRCTHGAAIGQLDEDAMFYLRARGIAEVDARNLLIHAFAGEVLDGVGSEVVRDRAVRLIEDKLSLAHLAAAPELPAAAG